MRKACVYSRTKCLLLCVALLMLVVLPFFVGRRFCSIGHNAKVTSAKEGYTVLEITCTGIEEGNLIMQDGLYGLIDARGKVLVAPKYELFEGYPPYGEGLARVRYRGKWGFIDREGREVVNAQYEDAHDFSEGLAAVRLYDKWGYVDHRGKLCISLQYEQAQSFSEDLAAVCYNGYWGYINVQGIWVIPPRYTDARGFVGGLAPVSRSGRWGLVDAKGQECVPVQYDEVDDCADKLYKFRLGTKWGLCNGAGRIVQGCKYDKVGYSHYGVIEVSLVGRVGLLDSRTAKELIPPRYDEIRLPQHQGLYTVRLGELYGYVDTLGRELVIPQYEEAYPFGSDGFAQVYRGKERIFIDKQGKEIKGYGSKRI